MANPILSQMNARQIIQIWQQAKNISNPQEYMRKMLCNSPKWHEIEKVVSQYGNNPKDAFYALAEQNNVNTDDILNMLR